MKLLIRADAGPKIGSGHCVRCLAFAKAMMKKGHKVEWLISNSAPDMIRYIKDAGVNVEIIKCKTVSEDILKTAALAKRVKASWVVLDGYNFSVRFQKSLKTKGFKLIWIDDLGTSDEFPADIVINHNMYASSELYPQRKIYNQLLLGPMYALLRDGFLSCAKTKRIKNSQAKKVLISLGGSKTFELLENIVLSLKHISVKLHIRIIAGTSDEVSFNKLIQITCPTKHKIELFRFVEEMPKIMKWADLAITGGGVSTLEAACMGLPCLSYSLANNQLPVIESMSKKGCLVNMGWHSDFKSKKINNAVNEILLSPLKRRKMSEIGRSLVDGKTFERIDLIMDLTDIRIRPVTIEDCRTIYNWANDPVTRNASFSSEKIPWEQHKKWYINQIQNPETYFYIAESSKGKSLGQIRFTSKFGIATISVSIAPIFRSYGLAAKIIYQASLFVKKEYGISRIEAYIKTDNVKSVNSFKKAGYTFAGKTKVINSAAFRMEF